MNFLRKGGGGLRKAIVMGGGGGGGIGAGRVPTVAAITTALSPTPELLPLKVTHRSPLLTHLKVAIAACAS